MSTPQIVLPGVVVVDQFQGINLSGVASWLTFSEVTAIPTAIPIQAYLRCNWPQQEKIPAMDIHRAVKFLEHVPATVAIHCTENELGRVGVALAARLLSPDCDLQGAMDTVQRILPGTFQHAEHQQSVWEYSMFRRLNRWPSTQVSYNFCPAFPLDTFVFGAERPGYQGTPPVDDKQIELWIAFMLRQGIQQVVCLLPPEQLSYYQHDLLARYHSHFDRVTHVPIADYELPDISALKQILQVLHQAEQANQRVVVHCSAGVGRTGIVLAAWSVVRHGLPPATAASTVRTSATFFGAIRNPGEAGPAQTQALLANFTSLGSRHD